MGDETDTQPGAEILKAARLAKEKKSLLLCDRRFKSPLNERENEQSLNKAKLIATIISAVFSNEKLSEEDLRI